MLQYFLILAQSEYNPIGWAVLIPAALIIQFIIIRNQKKKIQIKTHVESLLNTMWTAFGITFMIVLFFSNKLRLNTYPVILCLYAISTFISGSAFKIKAFVLGSILCWIFAIVCFFVDFQTQLLLLSAGVLVAFLIPGIVLRANEKAVEN